MPILAVMILGWPVGQAADAKENRPTVSLSALEFQTAAKRQKALMDQCPTPTPSQAVKIKYDKDEDTIEVTPNCVKIEKGVDFEFSVEGLPNGYTLEIEFERTLDAANTKYRKGPFKKDASVQGCNPRGRYTVVKGGRTCPAAGPKQLKPQNGVSSGVNFAYTVSVYDAEGEHVKSTDPGVMVYP